MKKQNAKDISKKKINKKLIDALKEVEDIEKGIIKAKRYKNFKEVLKELDK